MYKLFILKIEKNKQLKKVFTFLSVFVLFCFLFSPTFSLAADAGRHFGYQGQLLNTSGEAQTGTYTMAFKFYDAVSSGSQQGSTITKSVSVANGYFAVDFSASDLSGIIFNQDLWMEMTVSGTTLSPRSPVNSVPYSNVAFGIISGSGAPALSNPADGALYFDTTGNDLYVYDGASWVTVGSGSGVTDHGDLTGLQGGNGSDEYYHLNFNDYSLLTAAESQLSALMTDGSPTFEGLTSSSSINISNALYFNEANNTQPVIGFDNGDGGGLLTLTGGSSGSTTQGAKIRLMGINADDLGGDMGGLSLYAANDGWIANYTNNINRLEISPTGGVGINAHNYRVNYGDLPTNDKLTVFGNIGNIFDDTNISDGITQIGSTYVDVNAFFFSVAIQGSNAFVVDPSSYQLVSMDINTATPVKIASVGLNNGCGSYIKIKGNYAYIGGSCHMVQVFDISNPSDMVEVAEIPISSSSRDIEINGKYLYAISNDNIMVFDITNINNSVVVSSTYVPGSSSFYDFTIKDNYLYIADANNDRIGIYDLSDPINPSYVTSVNLSNAAGDYPMKLQVSGNYVYSTSYVGDFQVIDISDKNNPSLLSTVVAFSGNSLGARFSDMTLAGRYIYANDTYGFLYVIDVKNPNDPVIVKKISTTSDRALAVQGKKIVLVGGEDFSVFDASGLETSNALIHSLEAGSVSIQNGLSVNGNISTNGALNIGKGGILSDGAVGVGGILTLAKELSVGGTVGDAGQVLTSQGPGLAPSWTSLSLSIAGLTSNEDITQLGGYYSDLDTIVPRAMAVKGSNIFVLDPPNAQMIALDTNIDNNDSNQPTEISRVDFNSGSGTTIKIAGDYAYVGESNGAIEIFNISNPASMDSGRAISLPSDFGYVNDIEINGRYLYVLGTSNEAEDKIKVFDITDPIAPIELSTIVAPTISTDITIQNNFMYVLDQNDDFLNAYEMSDPVNPNLSGTIGVSTNPLKSVASGNYLYSISSSGYLDIIRISNKAAPVYLSQLELNGNVPYDLAVAGRYVYIATDDQRMKVVDVSSPTNPVIVKNIDTPFTATNISIQGKKIIISGGNSVAVFDASGIETASALVHSLEAGSLFVQNNLSVNGNISTNGALNIGSGGINSNGAVAIGGVLTLGNEIYLDGTAGNAGQVLTSQGAGLAPIWADASGGGGIAFNSNEDITPIGNDINFSSGNFSAVEMKGSYAYAVDYTNNDLILIDTTPDPSGNNGPIVLSTLSLSEPGNFVKIYGNYAYIGGSTGYIQVVDISDPVNMNVVTSFLPQGYSVGIYDIEISGVYLYSMVRTIDDESYIIVTRISNPSVPEFVSSVFINSHIDMTIEGNFLYALHDGVGFDVFSILDPSSVEYISSSETIGSAVYKIAVSGRFAYIIDDAPSFHVYDVSDKSNPVLLSTTDLDNTPTTIFMSGKYAYVRATGGSEAFLNIIDIQDPHTPVIVKNITFDYYRTQIFTVQGKKLVWFGQGRAGMYDLAGIETSNALIHSLEAGTVSIQNGLSVNGNISTNGALNIGKGGILSDGAVGVGGILTLAKELSVGGDVGEDGDILISQGAGLAPVWSSTTVFKQNGNSFGADAVIGTTDSYDLLFKQSGNVKMRLSVNEFLPESSGIDLGSSTKQWGAFHLYGADGLTIHNDFTDTDKFTILYAGSAVNMNSTQSLNIDSNDGITIGQNGADIIIGSISAGGSLALNAPTAVTIHGSATTCSIGNGTGTTSCTSDGRLKENVTNLDDSTLAKIMALRPVTFNWNSISGHDGSISHIGLIAQEVQTQFGDAVHTVYHSDALNDDVLGVDYGYLVVPAIKAIQEQQALLGDIATLEGMTTLVTDIQNEVAYSAVEIINQKIQDNKKFLSDFVVARITALRGYFDEIFAKKATLDEVCLKDSSGISCYTRSQLDAVVNGSNSTPTPSETPSDSSTENNTDTSSTTDDTVVTTEPAPDTTTTETPTDTPAPTEEATPIE